MKIEKNEERRPSRFRGDECVVIGDGYAVGGERPDDD